MPSIVSPSPRRIAHAYFQDALQSPSPFSETHNCQFAGLNSELVTSRMLLSPPRLLSPIALSEPHFLSLKSKSSTPCGTTATRRGSTRTTRSVNKRRRFPPCIEPPFDACGHASMFDRLPWISTMKVPPRFNPCDTADLSQLPMAVEESAFLDAIPASGPVRRRKASLRSNPLGNFPEPESSSRPLFPLHQFTGGDRNCLKTPPPRVPFDPARVTFHNLMPVFPHGVVQHSPP